MCWESVLLVYRIINNEKTFDNWKVAYVYYLKKLGAMSFIGDAVIHRTLTRKKYVVMTTQEFVDRMMVIMSYTVLGRWLAHHMIFILRMYSGSLTFLVNVRSPKVLFLRYRLS